LTRCRPGATVPPPFDVPAGRPTGRAPARRPAFARQEGDCHVGHQDRAQHRGLSSRGQVAGVLPRRDRADGLQVRRAERADGAGPVLGGEVLGLGLDGARSAGDQGDARQARAEGERPELPRPDGPAGGEHPVPHAGDPLRRRAGGPVHQHRRGRGPLVDERRRGVRDHPLHVAADPAGGRAPQGPRRAGAAPEVHREAPAVPEDPGPGEVALHELQSGHGQHLHVRRQSVRRAAPHRQADRPRPRQGREDDAGGRQGHGRAQRLRVRRRRDRLAEGRLDPPQGRLRRRAGGRVRHRGAGRTQHRLPEEGAARQVSYLRRRTSR